MFSEATITSSRQLLDAIENQAQIYRFENIAGWIINEYDVDIELTDEFLGIGTCPWPLIDVSGEAEELEL